MGSFRIYLDPSCNYLENDPAHLRIFLGMIGCQQVGQGYDGIRKRNYLLVSPLDSRFSIEDACSCSVVERVEPDH